MSSMVDLVFTTALCTCLCASVAVCVHIHACLLAVYICGEKECYVFILTLKYFFLPLFFLDVSKRKKKIGTYIYSCEQE